jgi:hypothetical protein
MQPDPIRALLQSLVQSFIVHQMAVPAPEHKTECQAGAILQMPHIVLPIMKAGNRRPQGAGPVRTSVIYRFDDSRGARLFLHPLQPRRVLVDDHFGPLERGAKLLFHFVAYRMRP